MEALDTTVDCVECGSEYTLRQWRDSHRCRGCGEPHEIPWLVHAVEAVERGVCSGSTLTEVVEGFGLSGDDAADLLMALGCSAEAAVDVERTVFDGRVRSEWRRLVNRTREKELENYSEVADVLEGHGVTFQPPDE